MAKGCTIDSETLQRSVAFLNATIDKQEIKSVSKEVREFIKEFSVKSSKEKNFSPERVLRLRGALLSFLTVHDITPNKQLSSVMDTFHKTNLSSAASTLFSRCFDEVYRLLEGYRYREFDEAKLYFIDSDAHAKIVSLQKELEAAITTETEKRKLKFNKIVNLVNPVFFAIQYNVTFKKKYQYISKKESLEKYLPQHYAIIKNKVKKDYRELIYSHDFSQSKKRLIESQMNVELAKIDSEFAFLQEALQNEEDVDIKILSYEHSSTYPEIRFTLNEDDKTKTRYAHLRSEVINVLWYEPIQIKSSSTISDILEHYNHAFGDVYYQHECRQANKQ